MKALLARKALYSSSRILPPVSLPLPCPHLAASLGGCRSGHSQQIMRSHPVFRANFPKAKPHPTRKKTGGHGFIGLPESRLRLHAPRKSLEMNVRRRDDLMTIDDARF